MTAFANPDIALSHMSYAVLADMQNRTYHLRFAWMDVYNLPEAVLARVETVERHPEPSWLSVVLAFDSIHDDYENSYAEASMFAEHPELVQSYLQTIEGKRGTVSEQTRQSKLGVFALGIAMQTILPERHIAHIWHAFRKYSNSVRQPHNGVLGCAS